MRQMFLACASALVFASAGGAAGVSGEWSTSLVLGSGDLFSSSTLALSTTLSSWELTSTSVFTPHGWESQALSFQQDLGMLAISGGLAFALPTDQGGGAFQRVGEGLRWESPGVELTAWDLSLELSLGRLTLGLTFVQRVAPEK